MMKPTPPSDVSPTGVPGATPAPRPRHPLALALLVGVAGAAGMMLPSLLLLMRPASGPTMADGSLVQVQLDPQAVKRGKTLYAESCTACHAASGLGVKGIGKDLVHSPFIAESDDATLLEFMRVGRAADHPLNTTGVAMPPKGGNPTLTQDNLSDLVTYMRSIKK